MHFSMTAAKSGPGKKQSDESKRSPRLSRACGRNPAHPEDAAAGIAVIDLFASVLEVTCLGRWSVSCLRFQLRFGGSAGRLFVLSRGLDLS